MFEQRIDNIVGVAYAMDLLDLVQKVRLPLLVIDPYMLFYITRFTFIWKLCREIC